MSRKDGMARAASGGDGDWRALELRRRVENRRAGAAGAARASPQPAWSPKASGSPLGTELTPVAPLTISTPPADPRAACNPEASRAVLPQLLSAKHEAHEIHMEIIDMETRQNVALASCDRQFATESAVRLIASDITAVRHQVGEKHAMLEDMHCRVLRMSKTLHDSSQEKSFASTKLRIEDDVRQQRFRSQHCPMCGKQFVSTIAHQHLRHCIVNPRVESLPIISTPSNQLSHNSQIPRSISSTVISTESVLVLPAIESAPALPRFFSQPPRNFRVVEDCINHRSIMFAWDPPIFTGSNPIFDYELVHVVNHQRTKIDQRPTEQQMCSLATSRWCLRVPVAPNQYVLDNLEADQEYTNFTLAAITANGKSAPSNHIDLVKTAPSVEPSQPLFLCFGAVTATSITLSWIEPLDSGGKPIVDYDIMFIEAIMKDQDATRFEAGFLNVAEVAYRPRRIRTYSSATSFTVTDLLSGKEHKQFRVRAVNSDGKPGDFSEAIESIFTIAPGNEHLLLDELQAAVNSKARIIDSQFLSGFMQRYDRLHYIQLVSQCITTTHPQFNDQVDAILNGMNVDAAANYEPAIEVGAAVIPTIKRYDDLNEQEKVAERRRQFHFRIAELRDELKRAEYNVQWCIDRQLDLVALIRSAEARILEKQAELERARMFRGAQMDSDVFENGRQRFYTKQLILALEDEIDIDQLYIVDTKAEMVQVENYLRADKKRRDSILKRLEDRQQALAEFEQHPVCISEGRIPAAALSRLKHGRLYRAFIALAKNRQDIKEIKEKVAAAFTRIRNYHLRVALRKWSSAARYSEDETYPSVGELAGIGSRELVGVAISRDDLLSETQDILKQMRTVNNTLSSIKWTTDQLLKQQESSSAVAVPNYDCFEKEGRTIEHLEFERYAAVLLEADTRMGLQEFATSFRLYQMIYNNEKWASLMSAQQTTVLMIKIGKANFALGQFEQAAAQFRRASLTASRSSLRNEYAEAELKLGDVYFRLRSLRSSIECYDQSLVAFEAIGDKVGQLNCHRGLQQCYEKLGDQEMEQNNQKLADEIEFALANALTSANHQLNSLQKRIVGVGAESSCEITLERVGAIVPRLRRERIKLKLGIREELRFTESLEKLLAEKKKLLAEGEEDLKRALASDSSEVDSFVMNGCSARYEIENFKKKLAKLMGAVRAGEETISREIANAKVRVRNAEDEIHELEQELIVETGALMQRMMGKERLRCFSFNAANEHLKNVVGTASGGFSTCVAAANMSGLLFDVLTGACLAHALGDPRKEHLGAPTGHQAPIISLFYTGRRVYTGCADATLGVWDVQDELIGGFSMSLFKMMYDFDASVVSVTADTEWVACGCSDCDVFVFDTRSLCIVARIISAHTQTVSSLHVISSRGVLTTGGADHIVKVWQLDASGTGGSSTRRRAKAVFILEISSVGEVPKGRHRGHLNTITCIKQAANEIVSGDSGGRVVVWSLDADSKLLRSCDPHPDASVLCLQFDATRIVSGSSIGTICVIDFATGNLLQTLHGHRSGVMDLQFDRKRLVSMSSDGNMRLWYWLAAGTGDGKVKKFHILGAGETLRSLSLKYRTSTQNLLQWNGLPDSTYVYLGQKLIVGVTDAEGSVAAYEEELKMLDRASSATFGKLSYEDLDFVSANQAKTTDVESQWAAQKVALLAKEYFPPLVDENEKAPDEKDDNEPDASEDESDGSEHDMPVEVEGEEGVDEGSDGDDESEGNGSENSH